MLRINTTTEMGPTSDPHEDLALARSTFRSLRPPPGGLNHFSAPLFIQPNNSKPHGRAWVTQNRYFFSSALRAGPYFFKISSWRAPVQEHRRNTELRSTVTISLERGMLPKKDPSYVRGCGRPHPATMGLARSISSLGLTHSGAASGALGQVRSRPFSTYVGYSMRAGVLASTTLTIWMSWCWTPPPPDTNWMSSGVRLRISAAASTRFLGTRIDVLDM